jgi:hypothetical protein
MRVAQGKRSAALGKEAKMNIRALSGLPCRASGSARQTRKSGIEVGGAVTQGGGRCAPLPWAIFSLPLRGDRQSLLRRL